MSQCESSSGSLIIGCLASGFSPPSLDFKWKDQDGKDLNDFTDYPTVQNGVNTFKVSIMTITKEKFNQSNITCEAKHNGSGSFSERFRKVSPQKPTLSVVSVITQKSLSVMCVVENFYPKNVTVQLKEKDDKRRKSKLDYRVNAEGLYTAYSVYKISSESWNSNSEYTCEVTHQGEPITETANFKAKFALTLSPPIARELFVNKKVVLEAVVSGDLENVVNEASVLCNVKEAVKSEKGTFSQDISQYIRKHNVTVDIEKWFSGEKVTCTIYDKNNNREIKKEIHLNKGDGQKPTVLIYKPDNDKDHVSHVCEVRGSALSNVYIMWKVDGDTEYKEGITSAPIRQNGSTSVLSILRLKKEDTKKLMTFICAVIHASKDSLTAPLQTSTSPSKSIEVSCE